MKYIIAVLVLTWTGMANAVLLTFDDIEGGSIQNDHNRVDTYQGFMFSRQMAWIDVVGGLWNYGAHSGDFAAINNVTGGIVSITQENGNDFTFDGLWAKKWKTKPESGGNDYLNGTLAGYHNDNLIWRVDTQLNGSYQFFGPQSGAIDELRMGFGAFFLVDDIALNESQVVSNPMVLWLFGAGLLGMVGFKRKF